MRIFVYVFTLLKKNMIAFIKNDRKLKFQQYNQGHYECKQIINYKYKKIWRVRATSFLEQRTNETKCSHN